MLRDGFKKGAKRLLFCLATGGGKTVIFTDLARRISEKGNRVLILTDRIELLKQAGGTFYKFGLDPYFIRAGGRVKNIPDHHSTYIGMVETVARRIDKVSFPHFHMVIIDECHKGNFKKIMKHPHFKDSFFAGFTATPIAESKRDPLKNYYDDIIIPCQIGDLIQAGYLCEYSHVMAEASIKDSDLQKDYKGEFTTKSQTNAFDSPSIITGLENSYNEFFKDGKTLIFCPSIEVVDHVHSLLISLGASTVFKAHSKLPDRSSIQAFVKSRAPAIMVNCGILTTGFDCPDIDHIVLYRATTSMPLYFQMIGRGSRPAPGKPFFTVIDHGGNGHRFNKWDQNIPWKELFHHPRKPKDGQAPVKECPKCRALIHISIMTCNELLYPNGVDKPPVVCGHIFPPPEKNEAEFSGFSYLTNPPEFYRKKHWNRMSLHQLEELGKARGYKKRWLTIQASERPPDEIEEFCRDTERDPKDFKIQIEIIKKYLYEHS